MFSVESSKFMETDAMELSGFATPTSHSPVSGTGGADSVAVGSIREGSVGVAAGEEHAASIQSRIKVDMRRMDGSIFQ